MSVAMNRIRNSKEAQKYDRSHHAKGDLVLFLPRQ